MATRDLFVVRLLALKGSVIAPVVPFGVLSGREVVVKRLLKLVSELGRSGQAQEFQIQLNPSNGHASLGDAVADQVGQDKIVWEMFSGTGTSG